MENRSGSEDETDSSILDPRIQIELEKLNSATDEINSLEVAIDEANKTFTMLLNEATKRLKLLKKKLGSCIERARPYYDALDVAKQAQLECQKAAVQYQRSNEIHQAAKETVALAEDRFLSKQHEWQFDSAWQEMLNHATIKVMEAETQKTESGLEHQRRALLFNQAEQQVQTLESRLRRSINKSRPYFEEKSLCQHQLATQKERINFLQHKVTKVKHGYAMSLKELERISEEIHTRRGDYDIGVREPGVGAENTNFVEEIGYNDAENKHQNRNELTLNRTSLNQLQESVSKLNNSPSLNLSDVDFESELEKCDLRSLGSVSVATSSAVSEDECLDDSEFEELKEMAGGGSGDCKTEPEGCDVVDVCRRRPSDTTFDSVRRLSESWEKQMSETINKLGNILNVKQKEFTVCTEDKEKY